MSHIAHLFPPRRLLQPTLALGTTFLALLLLVVSWRASLPALSRYTLEQLLSASLLTIGLVTAIVVSGRYPIHVDHKTKIVMASVPLYLLAVLLPAPVAAAAAALAMLLIEYQRKALSLSSAVTASLRWVRQSSWDRSWPSCRDPRRSIAPPLWPPQS